MCFFFNDTATTEIYTLSLHDALPILMVPAVDTSLSSRRVLVTEFVEGRGFGEVKALDEAERDRFAEVVYRFFWGLLTDRKSTRLNSSHANISYAVFCLKKKKKLCIYK